MNGLANILVGPGAVVLGALFLAIGAPRGLRPRSATRLLTTLTVVSALTVVWVLAVVVFTNVVQLHGIAERLSWCSTLATSHVDVPTPPGVLAFLLLCASFVGALRALRSQRAVRAPRGSEPFAVLPLDVPTAYALAGRPGQVVVSRGMLEVLDGPERAALVAHEQAHLRLHHHRYMGLSTVAAAAVPFLRPLVRRVKVATERWADEEAARVVGDRGVVARAIAHAALATTAPPGALALGDTGTVQRVEALLSDAPPREWKIECAWHTGVAVVIAGLGASVLQVHHWIVHVLGLCSLS